MRCQDDPVKTRLIFFFFSRDPEENYGKYIIQARCYSVIINDSIFAPPPPHPPSSPRLKNVGWKLNFQCR